MNNMKPKKGTIPAGMYADGGMVKKVEKVAAKKVAEHEARMHGKKMADGGYVCGHKAGMSGQNMKK